jgi:hypothetical protein
VEDAQLSHIYWLEMLLLIFGANSSDDSVRGKIFEVLCTAVATWTELFAVIQYLEGKGRQLEPQLEIMNLEILFSKVMRYFTTWGSI